MDWSTRPISSIATHRLVKSPSSPAPPNSSGAVSPNEPSPPIFFTASTGKWWSTVPLRGVRRDLALRELADAAAELLVLQDSSNDPDMLHLPVRLLYAYVNVRLGRGTGPAQGRRTT